MNVIHFDLHKPMELHETITACIGYFDGLHKGHQKLLEKVLALSAKNGTTPALITFAPDPWIVLKHMSDIPHITTMKQRMQICEKAGIKMWIILHFDEKLANLSYQDFHTMVLGKLHLHTLVCGYDFHYAHKGEGSTKTLQEQNAFGVSVVAQVSSEHKKISSSRIEALLNEGDVERAATFLGRFFEMQGYVKKGQQVGGKNGFPTANLELRENYVIPKKGVYIGAVQVHGVWHRAMINIGNNPTYNYQKQVSIEAHLLDFHEYIYEEAVSFRFCQYLREEKKFEDVQALSEQLKQDLQTALIYFKEREEFVLCD